MDKFEYKMILCSSLDELGKPFKDAVSPLLAKLGLQGWEMCGIQAENSSCEWHIFFKRQIKGREV